MIVWSGWGFLVVVIAAIVGGGLTVVISELFGTLGLPRAAVAAPLLGLGGAAVLSWIVGRRLNTRPGREMIEKATGRTVILRQRHTLFWVPMEWWSVLMALAGVAVAFAVLTAPPKLPAGSEGPRHTPRLSSLIGAPSFPRSPHR